MGLFQQSTNRRGHLAIIGGAEQRSGPMDVLRSVLAINQAKRVAVIPTASAYPADISEIYTRAFQDLGAESIQVMDIRRPDEADRPEYLAFAGEADLIFFSGGDQVKLVGTLRNSRLMDLFRKRHASGTTIAGTSAGAAAASNPMIFDGDDAGMRKGAVRWDLGFGFLPGITVDTHFMERGRLPRLVQAICMGISDLALGLSEDTAMIIDSGGKGTVVGSGLVVTLDGRGIAHSTFPDTPIGSTYGVQGMKVGFLPAGTRFDLMHWAVSSAENYPDNHEALLLQEECYEGL